MIANAIRTLLLALVLLALLPLSSFAASCYKCHDQSDFAGKVVHAPVAKQDCAICHSPHVSKQLSLLKKPEAELCYSCHKKTAKRIKTSQVLHAPIREGKCSDCHQPHVASNRKLLKKTGSQLCNECHEDLGKDLKVLHRPFRQGNCNVCHTPHAGDDYRLLRKTGSGLCLDCHKVTSKLRNSHLDRKIKDLDCLACHDPHGGKDNTLMRSVEHRPFAQKNCRSCHGKADTTKLCLGCHKNSLASFNRVHSHLGAAASGNACTICHNPHVGDRPGLLPTNEGSVCRACHEDTFKRREQMLHKHQDWNQCSGCHFGHGGDYPSMLRNGSNVCAECHDLHKGFTHPIGEDAIDNRNGQPMDCLTCHNANDGSMYKYFMRGSGERGLCIQCHLSY